MTAEEQWKKDYRQRWVSAGLVALGLWFGLHSQAETIKAESERQADQLIAEQGKLQATLKAERANLLENIRAEHQKRQGTQLHEWQRRLFEDRMQLYKDLCETATKINDAAEPKDAVSLLPEWRQLRSRSALIADRSIIAYAKAMEDAVLLWAKTKDRHYKPDAEEAKNPRDITYCWGMIIYLSRTKAFGDVKLSPDQDTEEKETQTLVETIVPELEQWHIPAKPELYLPPAPVPD